MMGGNIKETHHFLIVRAGFSRLWEEMMLDDISHQILNLGQLQMLGNNVEQVSQESDPSTGVIVEMATGMPGL